MREQSVSDIERGKPGKNSLPHEGTNIRDLYDLLKDNAGYIIQFDIPPKPPAFYIALNQLTEFYGCDIRSFGHRQYMLAGEWVGDKYVDYLVARIEKEDTND